MKDHLISTCVLDWLPTCPRISLAIWTLKSNLKPQEKTRFCRRNPLSVEAKSKVSPWWSTGTTKNVHKTARKLKPSSQMACKSSATYTQNHWWSSGYCHSRVCLDTWGELVHNTWCISSLKKCLKICNSLIKHARFWYLVCLMYFRTKFCSRSYEKIDCLTEAWECLHLRRREVWGPVRWLRG